MFVDVETEAFLRKTNELGSDRKVGLWRVIVVQNLPYSDPRRNGKVNAHSFCSATVLWSRKVLAERK